MRCCLVVPGHARAVGNEVVCWLSRYAPALVPSQPTVGVGKGPHSQGCSVASLTARQWSAHVGIRGTRAQIGPTNQRLASPELMSSGASVSRLAFLPTLDHHPHPLRTDCIFVRLLSSPGIRIQIMGLHAQSRHEASLPAHDFVSSQERPAIICSPIQG